MAEWYNDPKFDADGGTAARAKKKLTERTNAMKKRNRVKSPSLADSGLGAEADDYLDRKDKLKNPITAIVDKVKSAFTGG